MLVKGERPEIIVFTMESLIFFINSSVLTPFFFMSSMTEVRERLCPLDISFSDLLKTNLGLSLLMA